MVHVVDESSSEAERFQLWFPSPVVENFPGFKRLTSDHLLVVRSGRHLQVAQLVFEVFTITVLSVVLQAGWLVMNHFLDAVHEFHIALEIY